MTPINFTCETNFRGLIVALMCKYIYSLYSSVAPPCFLADTLQDIQPTPRCWTGPATVSGAWASTPRPPGRELGQHTMTQAWGPASTRAPAVRDTTPTRRDTPPLLSAVPTEVSGFPLLSLSMVVYTYVVHMPLFLNSQDF